ncbi:MAG: polymer-forming cytoskeletal protein [Gloeobacteraceae cyanobacterium ES-bin-316]|nr:polymer-forming cytoskeletal protein [Ferruginibacter sp.]
MFTKKSKSDNDETISASASIIGAGNIITGDIESNGDIRVDGTIKGNIYGKAKVLVGPSGLVEGSMYCNEADISGTICGNITSTGLLVLKGNASVAGDIQTAKLFIEPTVSFNGQCHMGANILELKHDMPMAVNE